MAAIRRLVVKFGGSVLSGGEQIAEAARLVAECPAREKLVVVSAPLGMTDRLVSLVESVPAPVAPEERARVIAYGERISARLLAAVLGQRGVAARVIEPEDPEWPIATRGGAIDASIDVEESRRCTRRLLAPLLSRSVVIVCGFLGREGGTLTTLRRGGSDTTALALGAFLEATDVVLVKDVDGLQSANPKLVDGTTRIREVGTDELDHLARSGSPVVAPEALPFVGGPGQVRIAPFGAPLLEKVGTRLTRSTVPRGTSTGRAKGRPTAGAVTGLFRRPGEGLEAVARAVEGRDWLGLSATPTALTVYSAEGDIVDLLRSLHERKELKSLASLTGLAVENGHATDPDGRPNVPVIGAFGAAGRLHWVVRPTSRRPHRRRKARSRGSR